MASEGTVPAPVADAPGGSNGVERSRRRPAGFKVFSSAADAPRSRRPTDGVLLGAAILGAIVLSFHAPGPTALDTAATDLVAGLPGLAGWFWDVAYLLLLIWAACLLVLPLFAHGRTRLFFYQLLAAGSALGIAILVGGAEGTDTSTSLQGFINSTSPPIYVATRIAVATAVIVTASPDLARPLRLIGRWLIAIGMVSSIALGAALPIGVLAGFLIGFGSAAVVHLLFGSPGGRLTLGQVTEVLGELGVDATATRDAALQPRGVALTLASTSEGRPLVVKVFGRDAQDGQLVAATWYAIWHRGAKRVRVGRLQQVEHEAFVTLAAERGGVAVLPVLEAGETQQGDAVLVLDASARTLGSLEASEIDVERISGAWRVLDELHALGISHGHLDATTRGRARRRVAGAHRLRRGADRGVRGSVEDRPSPAPGDDGPRRRHRPCARRRRRRDRRRGPRRDPAVPAARGVRVRDPQRTARSEARPEGVPRADRGAHRTEIPPLEPLQRVTWQSLLKVAVAAFLASTLISAFANIGIDTIVDQFRNADGGGCWGRCCSRPSPRCRRRSRRWGRPCTRSGSGPC